MKRYLYVLLLAFSPLALSAQNNDGKDDAKAGYDDFRSEMMKKFNKSQNEMQDKYKAFREEALKGYVEFMRKSWEKMEGSKPVPAPVIKPVPPIIRKDGDDREKEWEEFEQKERELKKELEQLFQKKLELKKQRELEEQRRKEEEAKRQKELEEQHRKEQELKKQRELEEQRRKEEEAKRQKELELQRQKELELQRQKEQELKKQQELEEKRRKEEEAMRQKELELQRQRELEEQRRKEQEALIQKELELQRQKELELKKQRELEEQRRKEQEALRRKEQEALRQKELELQRQKEQEALRRKELEEQRRKEEEAMRQRELELQRQREQEQLKQKELEQLKQKELELQRQKELELKKQKELEEQRRKEEEALRQKELELQRQKELELKKQKELEEQRRKEQEALRQRELELQRQTELEEQRQKELEEQRRKEQEAMRQRELELQRQRELEEQRRKEEEAKRQRELELQRQRELELQREQELLKQKELELQRQKELEEERQRKNAKPVEMVLPPFNVKPQPQPIVPIEVSPSVFEKYVDCNAFGTSLKLRYNVAHKVTLAGVSENEVADAVEKMAGENTDKLIVDCIAMRDSKSLSDWAYINMLKEVTTAIYGSYSNSAVLLMAYVYMQSGYKMRLATDNGRLYMLFASDYTIFGKNYYFMDGDKYYSLDELPEHLCICNAAWPAEETLSLLIAGNQHFDAKTDKVKRVASTKYTGLDVNVKVNNNLLDFYSSYPKSMINNDPTSTWAMYANTPMDSSVVAQVYPTLKAQIEGLSKLEAVNKLLHFVQTGLVYKYDNEVWGYDRPFFAEESLYYDYADCEDRSILFTRLVRDLLDVECVLIYVPGHLLAAVRLTDDIKGDFILVEGRKFMLCEPTCLNGASVGWSNVAEDVKMQAVRLK